MTQVLIRILKLLQKNLLLYFFRDDPFFFLVAFVNFLYITSEVHAVVFVNQVALQIKRVGIRKVQSPVEIFCNHTIWKTKYVLPLLQANHPFICDTSENILYVTSKFHILALVN